jgi:hypothetical protein
LVVDLRTLYIFNKDFLTYLILILDKVSFNFYVGSDSWKPYIGDLEIDLWLFSFGRKDQTLAEHFHTIRVRNITRFLQDKLSQFPKQYNSPEFVNILRQEAQNLSMKPNGKELLSFLGVIYASKAKAHLNRFSMAAISNKCSIFFNNIWFMVDLVSGLLALKNKRDTSQKEVKNVIVT